MYSPSHCWFPKFITLTINLDLTVLTAQLQYFQSRNIAPTFQNQDTQKSLSLFRSLLLKFLLDLKRLKIFIQISLVAVMVSNPIPNRLTSHLISKLL